MAIEAEARGFSGRYRSLNGARRSYRVGLAEVVMRAITVGGTVRGSRYQKTMRRSSIANMVLSSIASGRSSELTTTELYDQTETTEKTGVSFRLGMAFAAVAASRVVRVNAMKHVRPRGGGGRRADLVGMDKRRRWHVMEAKSRTYGIPRTLVREAKTQARATAAALAARGLAIDTRSACVTDLSGDQVYVLIEDPPPSDETDLVFEWSDEEFFADYYSPVPDLLSIRDPQPSGLDDIDEECVGTWLPGARVWLGLDRRLLDLDRAGRPWRDAARAHAWRAEAFEDEAREDVHHAPDGHALAIDPSVLEPGE
jgi:hypothetical protein